MENLQMTEFLPNDHLLYLFQCPTGHFSGQSSRPLAANAADQQDKSQLSRETCGNSKLFERLLTLRHSASILPVLGVLDIDLLL